MLVRLSVVLFAVSAVLAGGSGGYGDHSDHGGHESGSCDTAPVQCCAEYQKPSSEGYAGLVKGLNDQGLLNGINVPLEDFDFPIGVDCLPVTVIGGALGNDCEGTTTCCHDVTNDGIGVNCLPIALNV